MNKTWFRDTAERALATFAEAAIGLWILADGADFFKMSTLEGAGTAGVVAGLAVVKAALASHIGSKSSASLDPNLATVRVPDATPRVAE